jgi:putative hydrolase of the HAD superfamily
LERLNKNYRLVISSNSAREFLNLEVEKIKSYFNRVFSAPTDFQQLKKKTSFYQKICNLLGVDPAEMVHVGDRLDDDFVIPRKIGLMAYCLDREGEKSGEFFIRNLKEFEVRIENLESGN